MNQLKKKYIETTAPLCAEKFALKNVMQVPKLQKIVVNMGVGEATQNPKLIDEASKTLAAITGQKPVVTRAKKAISNFKLRENQAIGAKVTLHGERMFEFSNGSSTFRFLACVTSAASPARASTDVATTRSASRSRSSSWKSISTRSRRSWE
jgi:ribosomal protein L5